MTDSAEMTLPTVQVTAPAPQQQAQTAPYAVRALTFTFQLKKGSVGDTDGFSTLTLAGLRAVVHVEFASAPNTGSAQMRIFGMTLDTMNELSMAGLVYQARGNTVSVQAGDAISGMTTIFNGVISEAYPDMRGMPETAFYVMAMPTPIMQQKPVPPTTFPGAVPVSTALSQMAQVAGVTLENNGVTAVLQSPYFPGTIWSQMLSCVRAANCFGHLDMVNKVFAIWPKTGSRNSGGTPLIAPETGMIGYPEFQKLSTRIRVLFNPSLKAGVGQKIQVKSQLKAANGQFAIYGLTHDLSSQMPDGPWETTIIAQPV
jgi:hypothetical protein